MPSFLLSLPSVFADYELDVRSKGWFAEARLTVSEKSYSLNFFDALRFSQEIESELERAGMFFEPNLVIVRAVTRAEMERAAEKLVQSGRVAWLMPE